MRLTRRSWSVSAGRRSRTGSRRSFVRAAPQTGRCSSSTRRPAPPSSAPSETRHRMLTYGHATPSSTSRAWSSRKPRHGSIARPALHVPGRSTPARRSSAGAYRDSAEPRRLPVRRSDDLGGGKLVGRLPFIARLTLLGLLPDPVEVRRRVGRVVGWLDLGRVAARIVVRCRSGHVEQHVRKYRSINHTGGAEETGSTDGHAAALTVATDVSGP